VLATTLEARALSKSFAGPPLFSDLSFDAGVGLTAVLGKNGSGKTTLLKILAGLLRPGTGRVRVLEGGRELREDDRRRSLGWAGPDLAFYEDFSARENLAFFRRAGGARADRARLDRLLERVGLAGVGGRRVRAFSSGMKQRLRLAFALLFDSPVLLLDEPALGLDAEGRDLLSAIVREWRRAGPVVLASNDPRDFDRPEQTLELAGPGGSVLRQGASRV